MPHRIPFLRVLLAQLLLITLALCSVALAQDVVLSGADVNKAITAVQGHQWQMLAAAIIPGLLWVLRRLQSSSLSFFNSELGKAILTGVGAILGALAPVLDSGSFTVQSLLSALTVGFGSFFAVYNARSPAAKVPPAIGAVLALLLFSGMACAPPVVAGAAVVATVAGCATVPPAICPSGVLVPPDAAACALAFLTAAADLPASIAACRVDRTSAACVDSVIQQVKDLVPCEPTCAPVAGAKGTWQRVASSMLRTNICESLRTNGYPTACQ